MEDRKVETMAEEEKKQPKEEKWLNNKYTTILVVDDDEVNREFFEVMLKRLSFNIKTAVDGEEAMKKVLEGDISLILLDNLLPKYSGWEVTRIIRNEPEYEKYKNIPIIMFSAMNTSEGKIKGYDLGIDDYITKPFNFVEVLARIKAVLRHREVLDQIILREKHIAITSTLNKALLHFSKHVIKETMEALHTRAVDIIQADTIENPENTLRELSEILSRDAGKVLFAISELEKELLYLQKQRADIEAIQVNLDTFNEKYRDSLKELHNVNVQP